MLVLMFAGNLLGRKAFGSLWAYMSDMTGCYYRVDSMIVDSMLIGIEVIMGLT